MLVRMISALSGKANTLEIPITPQELYYVINRKSYGLTIQEIIPNVSIELREFLMSGILPDEWAETFGEEDE